LIIGNPIAYQFDTTYANDATDRTLSASNLSHRYLWNSQAVDQLFADEALSPLPPGASQGEGSAGYDLTSAGDVLWALTDHENTIRDLASYNAGTDTTTIANHRVFDSYGNLKSESNSAVDCLFGYTGRMYDEATRLQNNHNRWYDSRTGRWMSKDPIGFAGGDANLFRYVGNNPLGYTDPSGLCRGGIEAASPQTKSGWIPTERDIAEINRYIDAERTKKRDNISFLFDFLLGEGTTNRNYLPYDQETNEMRQSPGAAKLRDEFYVGGGVDINGGSAGEYGTARAAWESPPWGSTIDAQVGGFGGAQVINNGDGTATFKISNDAGEESFLYHGFYLIPVPNNPFGETGPMRTIHQTFQWTEKIDKSKIQ
jgi:RHS repeat-associated protein